MADRRQPVDDPESVDGALLESASKRSLLTLSHAMERAFDSRPVVGDAPVPGLVVALFQRREYFDREATRYAALARRGGTVVVGFTGSVAGLPEGVHAVRLALDDPLALEWSLVLLAGIYGSALQARDTLRLADGEPTLQASRLFRARWTFRRIAAIGHARRLLDHLGPQLPGPVLVAAQALVGASAALPVGDVEAQLSTAAQHLVSALDAGSRRAARMRAELDDSRSLAERDQLTGLHNRHYLERFLGGGRGAGSGRGGGADDPAGLGVLLVDVDDLKSVNDQLGHRAGDAVLVAVARTLRSSTRPADLVVRWGGDEFLVLGSGLSEAAAMSLAERLVDAVRRASPEQPWDSLPLSASIGVCLSPRTTLPLDALDAALYTVKRSGKGRAALAANAVPAA